MRTQKYLLICLLSLTLFPHLAFSGGTGVDHGRGTLGGDLLDFKPVTDERISQLNQEVMDRVNKFNFSEIEALRSISEELLSPILEMTEDAYKNPNQYIGDWKHGGLLFGYTDLIPGAPTMIYPTALQPVDEGGLSDVQLKQLLLHEALHRALPSPMNGYELLVVNLTRIVLLHSESQVVDTAKRVLQQYKDIRPELYVYYNPMVTLPAFSVSHEKVDVLSKLEFPDYNEIFHPSRWQKLTLKNQTVVIFKNNTEELGIPARFRVSFEFSKVEYIEALFDPYNFQHNIGEQNSGAYTWWKLNANYGALLGAGTIKVKIQDSFTGNDEWLEIDLAREGIATLAPTGKPYPYKVSEPENCWNIIVEKKKIKSLQTIETVVFGKEDILSSQRKQLLKVVEVIQNRIKTYLENFDFNRPVF